MKGIFFILAACFLWAADTLIRYPLIGKGVSAEQIVLCEHILLALAFFPFLYKSRQKIWSARVSHIFYFLIIGGFGSALGTLAFTKAFAIINPSLVILLQKLQPIVAILLAKVILKESLQRKFLYWAALCLLGGFLVSYKDIAPGLSSLNFSSNLFGHKSLLGYGFALVAVISWGSSTVFGKKLSQEGYSTKEIMGGRFFMGLLCLLPLLISNVSLLKWEGLVWGKIALMVVISGLLGMYFYYRGLKILPAKLCALAEMFFPVCAVGINWLVLDAALDPVQLIGGALLLIGSTIIQVKHY